MNTLAPLLGLAFERLLMATFRFFLQRKLEAFLNENRCKHILPTCLPKVSTLELVIQSLQLLSAELAQGTNLTVPFRGVDTGNVDVRGYAISLEST